MVLEELDKTEISRRKGRIKRLFVFLSYCEKEKALFDFFSVEKRQILLNILRIVIQSNSHKWMFA